MKKTIFPDREEYNSTLGGSIYKTPYGYISSWESGRWHHYSVNKQGWYVGESWWIDGHHYNVIL